MTLRTSQMVVTAALATLFSLVVIGNLTDYGTNLEFIRHVMTMDTVLPFAGTRYRAISAPWLHHAAYLTIIATEIVATAAAWRGVVGMWAVRKAGPEEFARARRNAVGGLTLALVLWQVGLIGLGSEWFGMWMSTQWSGLDNAFRFVVMTLGALIYLSVPEGDAAGG